MKKQPSLIQFWLALTHLGFATAHWLMVLYHVGRLDADPFDTPEDHDLSFEQAKAIAARRQR